MNKRIRKKVIARVYFRRSYSAFKVWCDLGFLCRCNVCRGARREDALLVNNPGHVSVRRARAAERRFARAYSYAVLANLIDELEATHSKSVFTTASIPVEYWRTDVKRT